MRLYIEYTNKWTEVRVRKWNGHSDGEDFSNEILTDYKDGGQYTEQEIIDVIDWCRYYCNENECYLFVEEGGDW